MLVELQQDLARAWQAVASGATGRFLG